MGLAAAERDALASAILAALDHGAQMPLLTADRPALGLDDAYEVSAAVVGLRRARGERPIGWKIGFTNRTIWDEYGVHAPIWGPVYDSTVTEVGEGCAAICDLGPLVEPRIEPEIVFRIATPPDPAMDERALLGCLDGIGHGFEIVQSLFPGWRFAAADTVAAFALHGRLVHPPFRPIPAGRGGSDLVEALARFSISLDRDGAAVDTGLGSNVLGGGPLTALRHLVAGLARFDPFGLGLRPGDVVTTGTVTRAFPVAAGETWSTTVAGLPLPGFAIAFR